MYKNYNGQLISDLAVVNVRLMTIKWRRVILSVAVFVVFSLIIKMGSYYKMDGSLENNSKCNYSFLL